MNTWFVADLHYNHTNLVRGCSPWKDKTPCRDFDTVEEHNARLVENVNNTAKDNDILYIVGDFSFGGRQSVIDFRSQLRCRNIHLILGNHDHHIRKNATLVDSKKREIKAQSLFASVNEVLYKKICHEKMVLFHYSMRTWDSAGAGSIMLYGHTHGTFPDYSMELPAIINRSDGVTPIKEISTTVKFKTMDVGIDTHPSFRPYHIEEIRDVMKNRIPLIYNELL